jgi:ribosomal protein S18 acetylase RimI-like enzyme
MDLLVRNAEPADGPLIAAFNAAMANETEGKSLDRDLVGRGVDNLLANPSRGRYWVAETDGNVIGQLMVTYEWSDWRNGNVWWIQSVYIHPEWRRQGVFTALYRHVQSLASAEPGVIGLRLYVEDSNTRAQQTYETLGMVKPNYLVMEAMFGAEPNDAEK